MDESLKAALEQAGFTVVGRDSARITQVAATTIAIITLIEELMAVDKDGAETVLRASWLDVADQMHGRGKCENHSFMLISEYFKHGGDWQLMRKCLQGNARCNAEALAEIVASKLAQLRREYAEHKAKHVGEH